MQALRDEFALAGTPLAGDEDVAALFGALRESRDCASPVPSAQLTALLTHGFDPAPAPKRRVARAGRLAATGLTLKALVGATVLGAGVATASVVASIPGEELITETVDAILPDGGGDHDESSTPPGTLRTDDAGLIATTGLMPPPALPTATSSATERGAGSAVTDETAAPAGGLELPAVPAAPAGPGHVPGVPQGDGNENANPTPGVPNSGGHGNSGSGSGNSGNANSGSGSGSAGQENGNRPDTPPGQAYRPDTLPSKAKGTP